MSTKKSAPRGAAKKGPAREGEGPFFRPFADLPKAPAKPPASGAKGPSPTAKGREKPAPAATPKPPPKPPTKASKARAAQEESDTFATYMAGVEALPGARTRLPRTVDRIDRTERRAAGPDPREEDALSRLRALVTEGLRFDVTDDGRALEGRRIDIDPRELRRLRKGAYGIDGTLDLHGLSTEEARLAVEAFVKKRATEGDRVLCLVHGKGVHSPRGHAVLRGEIGAWLSQGRAARHVAAFASTRDADGFSGSLVVLLVRVLPGSSHGGAR